jgi:hypothetical protein
MISLADLFERCPVCRARLKDSMECRRCGLDFSPIVHAADEAEHLAAQAPHDLMRERPREAFFHALRAARIHVSSQTLKSLALAALAMRYFDLALALWQTLADSDSHTKEEAVDR